ncbi:MAG: tyrosine-type recombinase/integrase [Lachnospiraceae bacterium]|nr:tyrosine-type recombinase/integrase [Lachnospiraceae bacterium]
MEIIITEHIIAEFVHNLKEDEKSKATIEKYSSILRKLMLWLDGRNFGKQQLTDYRDYLLQSQTASTVNGVLSAVNSWMTYAGIEGCRIRHLKVQRRAFCSVKKEISRGEYNKLLHTAKRHGNERLYYAMETICSVGIRASELKYITVEAVERGRADIDLKGKNRTILLPEKLCRKLKRYAGKHKITSGPIFLSRNGNAMSRKQVWTEMKSLCGSADVDAGKVFPHNLRHLFARCFYKATHDVAKLADVLGHSSMETTRIYLVTSGEEHIRVLDSLQLVL